MNAPLLPRDAWTLRKLLAGQPVNGELEALSGPFQGIGAHLVTLPPEERLGAWGGFLAGKVNAAELNQALAAVDPLGPAPEAVTARRTAHLGDLSGANGAGRFLWKDWIVRGHFTLLTSDPKLGKTRIGLELAKRLWNGQPWPDGQEATLPAGTKTLWVPGDRHQDELRELACAYGLPAEAVFLNASPDNPYAGVCLDEEENVAGLRERVEDERPGIVYVDTVWRATQRKLCREDEVNLLMDPLIAIAQEFDVAIVGMMHASKEGETLGRRLEGLARAVIRLTKPDPEGQPGRRKLWVARANFLEPPPLGVTIHEIGCDFDLDPPSDTAPSRGGRPPEKSNKAVEFLKDELSERDRKQCELVDEWVALGEAKGTLFNTIKAMQSDGSLVLDDAVKPKVCHLVKNSAEGQ
jgi:hypothetical protein